MSPTPPILILEGPLTGGLAARLTAEGFSLLPMRRFASLLTHLEPSTPLVILDVMAPDFSWHHWQALINTYQGHVLLITPSFGKAHGETLTVPFDLPHLARRLRRILQHPPLIRLGSLLIDLDARSVSLDGRPLPLSQREHDLLAYLARRQGKVVSYQELLERVWGYPPGSQAHDLVRTCVKRLRCKLGEDPRRPHYLETVRGVGYRLRSPAQEAEAMSSPTPRREEPPPDR
ncbi:MAG: DNA-binding response regulator [Chloroflexi bacterium]|nr:MAG: DNA-binding response regulator [Chloroflexota bacterium]